MRKVQKTRRWGKVATLSISSVVALSTIGPMVGMPEFVALANADDSVSANYSVSTSAVAEKDGNGFLTGKVTLTYSLTNTTAQAYIANPQFILKNSSWDSASVTLQNLYDGRSVTRNVAASPDNSISFTTQPLGTLLASQKPFYQYQLVAPGSTFTVVMRGVSVSDATKMYFQQNPGRSASALPSSAQTDSAISASWDGIYSRVQAEFTRTSANASMAGVAWVLGNSASDAVDIQKATMAAFGSLLDTSNDESSSSAWSQSKAALLNSATATIDNTSFDEATKEQYRQDAQNASDATGVSSVANLAKGRDDAIHSLDTLTGLSEADKESLKQRILNEPDWTKIQDILDEAVAQSGMSIEDQRAAALQTLGTYTDLPAADRTTATTAINAATTPAAIRTALSAAASANNKAVSNARTSALNSVYALVNLDLPTVLGYVNSINAATTVAEINTQSRAASTADKAVLSAAQNQATTTIQALPLPDARRRYYLGQVTSASKVSLVNEVLANAQAESETSLDGIKYSATATINALANLDTDTKSNYTTQVDNATSVADVKSILSQAKIENSNKLETRRAEVQTAVSKLKLNSTRQDAYANSISQADSVATLNLLLAQAQAEASNDLSSYRTQALAIVTALANLDSTALNSWVSQINAATDMTKISDLKLAAIAADTQALETARSNAYSALGVLVNNTDGDTKNYQSMVYTLTTKKDIAALVDTATAKANERLKAARAAAEKSLEGLTYIDTSSYSDAIEDATMIKDVEAKVAAAVAANLDEAKKSATSTISGLGFIDTANYLSQVSVATTTTAVEQVTNNATAANTAARTSKIADAKATLSGLVNIDFGTRNSFLSQVENASTAASVDGILTLASTRDASALNSAIKDALGSLVNYPNLTSDFESEIKGTKDKALLAGILERAAQENDSNLQTAKSEATNTINAYGNLGKKQDYLDQVNSATKTSDITAIVSAAKALNGAITTALGTLADYPNTTTDFATQLKDVSSDAQIQGILDSAKNESNSNLATAKTTATNTINALVNLGTKQSYLNQVDAATKTTDIGTIVSAAQKLNQEITTAIEGLAQYPNLTSDFKSQLQAADSTAKISEILNSAKTENAANLQKAKTEAINTISAYGNLGTKQSYLDQVASATKRSDINSIVSAAQSLNQAITTAIADLAQYPNLTSDFTSQLQAADSTAKISKILNSAKTENTANLQKAKTEAINTISAYGNLGTKQSFIDRVNDATAASAIQGIITEANALNNAISDALTALADYPNTTTDFAGQLKNASSDAQIQGILDSAKNESNSNLATAKTTATNTINALVNLGTKQSYLDKVNAATKVSDIQDIVDAAQGLNQAITTAIADLAQYPNLSTDFKSQLQAADSTAKISEILGSAKNENASNLQTAKNKATATINALSNLGTKQSYLDQVDSATKTSDIDGIVANAQALNTAITTAIGELASYPDVTTNFTGQLKNVKSEAEIQPILEAAKAENTQNLSQSKTTATNTINALENLGTKSDYVNKVAAATTKDQVAGILAEAQALNTAITTAIGGLAQYPDVTTDFATQLKNVKSQADIQPILDAAKKENGTNLQTAKMQAITAIDELQNLGTKSDYVSKVQVAASGAEVQKILADAQSLNTAIGTALTELAQYPNITTDFATQLKNVTSVSELDGILAKAKTENATNLADAKSTAAETINGLSNLGTKQSYLDQVAAATKTSDIDTIVSAASGLNQEITTAIGKLAQYPNTTSDFLTQLKNVKSADELDGILAKAKNENDQNLAEAKSAAADTINGLANLGTKADYLSKVQSANTKDQITALVTQAQALNSAIGTALTELAQYTDVTGNYAEQLKNVTAEDQIKPILDSAKNENDTNVADAKTDAESSINRLQNLEAKQSFLDKVEAAKTVAEAKQAATDAGKLDSAIGTALSTLAQYTDVTGNYAEQLKNVTAESQIQPILDAAKTENEKNLAKAKTDAATSINALKNLEAKQSFLNKVADATTKNQISDIVTEAQTLDSEIGTALSTLAQYPDTTSNFADQLKNVTTQDQIQPILDAAKSENEQNLTTAKTAARKQINELTELGEDSSQYLDEIDRATTRAEIAEVVDKALAKIQTIKDNALGEVAQLINISDTDRATATAAINAAQDVAAIQAALAKAKSADTAGLSATKEAATTAIKANAWITDYTPYTSKLDSVTDKRNFQAVIDEATQANTTAETQAKAAATTEINTLSNLGDDQRKDLVAKANAATTPAELNTVLNNAHVQAQGNLDLAREMAIASVNALANLSDPEKNAYIERINAAPDQSTTISIVNEARAKDNEGLISAKRRAIEVINALQNVLQADKDNYVSTVDAAPDMVKVNAALAAALAADAEGLAYARQRADALISNLQGLDDVTREQLKDKAAKAGNLDEINNQVANAQNQAGAYVEQQRTVYIQQVQALVNLSDAQRSTYISQIQGTNSVTMMSLCALQALSADQTAVNDTRAAAVAKIKTLGNLSVDEAVDFINKVNYTATTSDEVEEFENQAIAQDTANLTNAVSDATSTVKLLKNLSDAEKSSILDNLDKQSTVDGVATSTSQAKLLDAQYLSQARDNALTAIGSLRNLDRSTVDGYLDEIRGVTSVSDAANLVSRATAADNEALNGYKTEQKTVIGALGDLDASEIADYQSQVDNAATRADVIKVVAAAKKANEDAIVAARADATAYLGTLVNLGDAVRQEYINQVGAAKTTQSINAIRADARNKDAQILSTTQTNAISVINGYSKLTSGERDAYKNQIQASRSTDDITRILQQAQADVANRPNSTKDSDISVGGEPAPQKKGLSGLAIAGIVGGVLAIIGLILALLMAR